MSSLVSSRVSKGGTESDMTSRGTDLQCSGNRHSNGDVQNDEFLEDGYLKRIRSSSSSSRYDRDISKEQETLCLLPVREIN